MDRERFSRSGTLNTIRWNLKGPTDLYRGAGIFTIPTSLKLHFNPCLKVCL